MYDKIKLMKLKKIKKIGFTVPLYSFKQNNYSNVKLRGGSKMMCSINFIISVIDL